MFKYFSTGLYRDFISHFLIEYKTICELSVGAINYVHVVLVILPQDNRYHWRLLKYMGVCGSEQTVFCRRKRICNLVMQ